MKPIFYFVILAPLKELSFRETEPPDLLSTLDCSASFCLGPVKGVVKGADLWMFGSVEIFVLCSPNALLQQCYENIWFLVMRYGERIGWLANLMHCITEFCSDVGFHYPWPNCSGKYKFREGLGRGMSA